MNNPIIGLFRYVWMYSPNKKTTALYIVLAIIGHALLLADPILIGNAVTAAQNSLSGTNQLNTIYTNLAYWVLLIFVFWVFHGISRVLEVSNAFNVRKNFKVAMFDKVNDLPIEWHTDHPSGDTIDKINKAGDALFDYTELFFNVPSNAVKIIGTVIALAFFDIRASIIAVCACVILFSVIVIYDKFFLIKNYDEINKRENHLAAGIYDYLTNVFTIITLRLKKRVHSEISSRASSAYPIHKRGAAINESKWFVVNLLIVGIIALALGLNAHSSYVAHGFIAAGILVTLFKYLDGIGNTFYQFAWLYSSFVRFDVAVKATEPINEEHQNLTARSPEFLPHNWKNLHISGLTFQYKNGCQNGSSRNHLDNVSLTIPRGKRIALIGDSGSGKSTMLALIRGLYDPKTAIVECDGQMLSHGMNHLHEHVTLIPQEPEIFNTTILENVTVEMDADWNQVWQAICIAQFQGVIPELPNGLESNIAEKGVNLSGGQKQRLALARGILAAHQSDILLLDEPTSSVDPKRERLIYDGIFKTFPDKTIISTMHRLHLLPNFDTIYLFQNGSIVTHGTFNEIMQNKLFQSMWESYMVETSKEGKNSEEK